MNDTEKDYRIYKVNDGFLDTIGIKQAWFLGMMAADGYISSSSKFSIAQSGEVGKILIQQIREMIGSNGAIYESKTKAQNSYELYVNSPALIKRMGDYGIVRKKSLTLRFPMFDSEKLIRAFIRGYVEGDGSVGIYDNSKNSKYLTVSLVGTPEFVGAAKDEIPVLSSSMTNIQRARNLAELRFNGKKAVFFGDWLWQDAGLPITYKQRIYLDFKQNYSPAWMKSEGDQIKARFLLLQGHKPEEIGKMLGIAWQTVYAWRREWQTPSHLEER